MLHNTPSSPLSSNDIAFLEAAEQKYTALVGTADAVNLIMLNSRGVCKLTVGIATHSRQMVDAAIEDFITVTMLAESQSPEYIFAKHSLLLAHKANAHFLMLGVK